MDRTHTREPIMKTLTLTEAKAKLASVLEQASAGESITVTRRGKPVFVFNTGDVIVTRQTGDKAALEKGLSLVEKRKAKMKPTNLTAELDAVRYRHG